MKKYLLPIILYSDFLFALLVLVIITDKGQAELWINNHFSEPLGIFFKYATHLGDGLVYGLVFIFFLLYRYYYAILTALLIIIQTLIVQIMKRVVFASSPRPKAFFQDVEGVTLQFVEGVKVHSANSFPSGHTASAFAIATLLTIYFNNTKATVLLFLGAVVVAFSRVYLLQHFFEDVLVGAAIGIISTFLVIYLASSFLSQLDSSPKLKKGLLDK